MSPSVLALAAAGLGVGLLLARELRTHAYRIDGDRPLRPGRPFPAWVVPGLTAAVWAALAARVGGPGREAVLPAYLFFAVLAVALTWVDLDVHRLPDGLVLPAYPLLGVLLVAASVGTGHWLALRDATFTGAALGLFYLLLAVPPWGGPGLGDVKLAGVIGLLLGWENPWLAVLATWLAFLVSGVAAVVLVSTRRAGLRSHIAFGPGMLAGALLAPLIFQSVRR
ncbi:MAG TPA: A24 family peptidase [Candidatus Lustribacter sp.]|nr:A24 family peptidase [Candidatus Lustribacter sp.]